jgi:hypothetical protein
VHRSIGASCEELAAHLDAVHSAVEGELISLIEWTAGIEAAGGVLSVVSFGLAEAPTQVVEGARVASAAARIAGAIERFIELSRVAAARIASAADRAAQVSARLRAVLDAKLTEAAVSAVGRFRTLRWADDTGAIGLPGGGSPPRVFFYADREAARDGLEGDLRVASNRFFRRATAKCQAFKITRTSDGMYRMEYFAPANNVGYGKLYVKIIDSDGGTVDAFKDTLGPAGLIERKTMMRGAQ